MITDIYILGIGSLCSQISKRCSHDSLPDNHNRVYFQSCDVVILSVMAYITGHNFLYSLQWPQCTLIDHNAQAKISDGPLTLIFMIGHGACRFLFGLSRWAILSVCIWKAMSLINYQIYKTKNRWCSVDAQFENWAESIWRSLLNITAACTSFINICDQLQCRVTMLQNQTLLTHHWHTSSEWGRECVTLSFAYKRCLYLICECLHPISTQITQDARPKIIDLQLPLIFSMGQRACLTCFWW
jgi:hypothetical protein